MSRVLMFASNRPFKEVPLPSDYEIEIYIDANRRTVVDDGGRDDGFQIFTINGYLEIKTDKKYFAELVWTYTPGRAERIIEYIREHLKTTDEIELWHVWLDNDFDHKIRKRLVPIDELTAEMLREIDQLPVSAEPAERRPHCRGQIDLSEWEEPTIHYCYVITNPKGKTP